MPNITITANGIGAEELAALVKREIDKALAAADNRRQADARRSLHDG